MKKRVTGFKARCSSCGEKSRVMHYDTDWEVGSKPKPVCFECGKRWLRRIRLQNLTVRAYSKAIKGDSLKTKKFVEALALESYSERAPLLEKCSKKLKVKS